MKAKIKAGALIYHGRSMLRYPDLFKGKEADLNTVFDCTGGNEYIDCRTLGYGSIDHWGDGPILVRYFEDLEEV